MTIGAIACIIIFGLIFLGAAWMISDMLGDNKAVPWIIAVILICVMIFGSLWYFNNTASGKRALVDQHTELLNGLERTINVYTADGNLIASYEGKIDLEDNAGGYVLFDYQGKRYTYYNCFVESIAEID